MNENDLWVRKKTFSVKIMKGDDMTDMMISLFQ